MEPKTCPHCGYIWTPRKENPKKCPQCANPLWQSPRPKTHHGESSTEVEQPAEVDSKSLPNAGKTQGGDPCLSPPTIEDRLASARAKAEALFNKLK